MDYKSTVITSMDFKLFQVFYLKPGTAERIDVGEMRAWHARRFIEEMEKVGISVGVEGDGEENDVADFIEYLEYENTV